MRVAGIDRERRWDPLMGTNGPNPPSQSRRGVAFGKKGKRLFLALDRHREDYSITEHLPTVIVIELL